jgi:hypothetical protein
MIAIVSTTGQFQAKDYLGNESTLNLQFFRWSYGEYSYHEGVIDCCLTPNDQFSAISWNSMLHSMRWCLLCTRPTYLVGFLVLAP